MATKINCCGNCGEAGHNTRTCPEEKKPAQKKRKQGAQPGNTNAVTHGLYSRRFTEGEIEMIGLMETYRDVSSEISLVRVAIGRVIAQLQSGMDIDQSVALLNAIARSAGKIGQLFRIQELLFGGEQNKDEFLEGVFSEVLKELRLEND
jgi:hypothetical protein